MGDSAHDWAESSSGADGAALSINNVAAELRAGYAYAGLDHNRFEIRLLTFLPVLDGNASAQVECMLHHCALEAAPSYMALSYVWGASTVGQLILIDGMEQRVTANLYDALLQLRNENICPLWIDAISINQADIGERNEQVQKMRDIYANADAVISWLGKSDEQVNMTLERIEALQSLGFSCGIFSLLEPNPATLPEAQFSQVVDRVACAVQDSGLLDSKSVELLQMLDRRQYWTRGWIFQELCIAKQVILKFGERSCPWAHIECLAALAAWIISSQRYSSSHASAISDSPSLFVPNITTVAGMRANLQRHNSSLALLTIMRFVCNGSVRTTVMKDLVYAFLGLLGPLWELERNAINVNYEDSDEAIFTLVSHLVILRCGAGVLTYAGLAHKNELESLPSWAIDWTDRKLKMEFTGMSQMRDDATLSASLKSSMKSSCSFRGFCIGRLVHISTYSGVEASMDEVVNDVQSNVPRKFAHRSVVYTTFCITPRAALTLRAPARETIDRLCNHHDTSEAPPGPEGLAEDIDGTEEALPSPYPGMFDGVFPLAHQPDFEKRARHVYITDEGDIGSAPPYAQVGDSIWFLEDCKVPFLLRRRESTNTGWLLVSSTFVWDLMDGKIRKRRSLPLENVDLF